MASCTAQYSRSETGVELLTLENDLLRVVIVPEKGADIYSVIDLASGVDVLWKSPQGLLPAQPYTGPGGSETHWLERYEGGWQEIFPNGGSSCQVLGVELGFHGESTMRAWDVTILEQDEQHVTVEAHVRLRRSPLELRRRMTLRAGLATLFIEEEMVNWSEVAYPLMWGHHPALGAPLLSSEARLHTNARTVLADATYDPPLNPLVPGARSIWPHAQGKDERWLDLSRLPGAHERRDLLAYLLDFAGDPWFAVTNAALGLGVGFAWGAPFACCWLWQEVGAAQGFPWYGTAYTVACEPWTSYPGSGLAQVIETTGTHVTLGAGERLSTVFSMCCFHVPQDDQFQLAISRNGCVITV